MLGVEFSPPLVSRFAQNAALSPREEKEVSLLDWSWKNLQRIWIAAKKAAFLLRLVQDSAAR